MPCAACGKAAIDCTGYRKEMDNMVDLIIAGVVKKDEIVAEFIELQQGQEKGWIEFRAKHFPEFSQ